LRKHMTEVCKHALDLITRKCGFHDLKLVARRMHSMFKYGRSLSMEDVYRRKMATTETVREYAIGLETLYCRVCPKASYNKRQRVLAKIFRGGVPSSLLEYARLYPLPKTLDETVAALEHFEVAWSRTQTDTHTAHTAAGPGHERPCHEPWPVHTKRHDTNPSSNHTRYQGWPMQFCSWCTMNNHSLQQCTRLRAFMEQFSAPWSPRTWQKWPPFIPPMPPPPPGFAGRNATT
jgi:hypothetical protein